MQSDHTQRSPDGLGGSGGGGLPPLGSSPNVFRPGTPTSPPAGPGGGGVGNASSPPSGANFNLDKPEVKPKITAFEQKSGIGKTEDSWQRKTNKTGSGATHVKTFHAKLTGESLEFLDKQINDWLDAHPDHEVKFSTSTVGDWTGKLKEPNVIVQVWV